MLFSAAYYPPKSFETVKYYISFFRITAAVKAKIGSDTAKTCSIREKGVAIRCLPTRAIILSILQAREAMDRFKMEAASQVGVNLTNGYNGELTSRQAGSIGGQMVKKMIEAYENGMK